MFLPFMCLFYGGICPKALVKRAREKGSQDDCTALVMTSGTPGTRGTRGNEASPEASPGVPPLDLSGSFMIFRILSLTNHSLIDGIHCNFAHKPGIFL